MAIGQLRVASHRLEIETGRHTGDRIYRLCRERRWRVRSTLYVDAGLMWRSEIDMRPYLEDSPHSERSWTLEIRDS